MLLSSTVVTFVLIMLMSRSVDNFKKGLEEATVKVSDFGCVVNKLPKDEGFVYKIARVVARRGLNVGFCA